MTREKTKAMERREALAAIEDHLLKVTLPEYTSIRQLRNTFPGAGKSAVMALMQELERRGVVRIDERQGIDVVRLDREEAIGATLFGRHAIEAQLFIRIVAEGLDASPLRACQHTLEARAADLKEALKTERRGRIILAAEAFVQADVEMHLRLCDICSLGPLRHDIWGMFRRVLGFQVTDVAQLDRLSDIVEEHRRWSRPLLERGPKEKRLEESLDALARHLDQTKQRAISRLLESNLPGGGSVFERLAMKATKRNRVTGVRIRP